MASAIWHILAKLAKQVLLPLPQPQHRFILINHKIKTAENINAQQAIELIAIIHG